MREIYKTSSTLIKNINCTELPQNRKTKSIFDLKKVTDRALGEAY